MMLIDPNFDVIVMQDMQESHQMFFLMWGQGWGHEVGPSSSRSSIVSHLSKLLPGGANFEFGIPIFQHRGQILNPVQEF